MYFHNSRFIGFNLSVKIRFQLNKFYFYQATLMYFYASDLKTKKLTINDFI